MYYLGTLIIVILIASAYADKKFKKEKARKTRQSITSGLNQFDKRIEQY